ncbi:MAG: hypothetical protein QOI66_953 [Myxococcales bacterium]|jgi:hypothetical protein|nr:hypothetical protein [Myxococcales bacterium]
MMALAFLWSWLASAGPAITVEGDSLCPTAPDVAARVAELLPAATTTTAGVPDLARVDDQSGALRIRVQRPDGGLIGERTLTRSFPCPDLAAAAAVIIATWESDVHPEFRQSMPAARQPVAPAGVVTATTATAGAGSAFDIGAALSGSLAPSGGNSGAALGALIVASLTPGGQGFGGRLSLQGGTERELPLGAGAVRWRRLVIGAGPQLRLTSARPALRLDLHGDALLAYVTASGTGFSPNRQATSIDAGIAAGARLLFGGRSVQPWLDLSLAGWLRQENAYNDPGGASVPLPRVEAILALGLSFCAPP